MEWKIEMGKVKLFCIPYSGGLADVYCKWKNKLNSNIVLCPVEIAGHGRRIKEDFYTDVATAADDISGIILNEMKGDEPYAIYGHSLGALLAFETYYELKKKGVHEPVHIFFSGRKSPDDMEERTEYYKLPENDFMEKVFQYGGNTRDIMQSRELLDIFVPILRADFRIAEIYEYQKHDEKIMCDITIVNGKSDFSVMTGDLSMWKAFAGKGCDFKYVEGEHFFITENIEEPLRFL